MDYNPTINPRAYATPALLARLAGLLQARRQPTAGSEARWLETCAIAQELTRRGEESPLLLEASLLTPEVTKPTAGPARPARQLTPCRPARRITPY